MLSSVDIAHCDAWTKARVLHRDISVNNIMIHEYIVVDEQGNAEMRYRAVLCDWDLCKFAERMSVGRRTRNRVVRRG